MTEIARIERETAKHDPRQVFASPNDLVGEQMLTRGEKIATLNRWRAMILQELAAAGEGMQTHGVSSSQVRELDEIEQARLRLLPPEHQH